MSAAEHAGSRAVSVDDTIDHLRIEPMHGEFRVVSDSPTETADSTIEAAITPDVAQLAQALSQRIDIVAAGDELRLTHNRLTGREVFGLAAAEIAVCGGLYAPDVPRPARGMLMAMTIGLAGEALVNAATLTRAKYSAPLVLPDGYSLQCLQTGKDKKRVIVAVHPRGYPNSQEPVELTRERLAMALQVIAQAKNDKLDRIIIPGSLARRAGLPEGMANYRGTITSVTGKHPVIPYETTETAVILPPEMAETAATRIERTGNLSAAALAELIRRNPSQEAALSQSAANLKPTLLKILRRAAASEGGTTTTRETEPRPNMRRNRVDYTFTDITCGRNSHDPRITTINAKTGAALPSTTLRSMTAAEKLRLESGGITSESASAACLVRIALDTLEAAQERSHAGVSVSNPQTRGTEAAVVTPETSHPATRTAWALGRAAVYSGVIVAFGAGITTIATSADKPPAVPPVLNAEIFRVDNHGFPTGEQSRYWPRVVSTERIGNVWQDFSEASHILTLPTELPDPSVPHLSVRTYRLAPGLVLPIQEGTELATIKAEDSTGKALPVTVDVDQKGEVYADVQSRDEVYELTYDLVPQPEPNTPAIEPLTIGDSHEVTPEQLGSWQGMDARQAAADVQETFIYDANPAISIRLSQIQASGQYVAALEASPRCKCDQCNTLVAITQARAHPQQKLSFVSGFLKPPVGDHEYLASIEHAWLADTYGVVDATATNLDSKSTPTPKENNATLDQAWASNGQLVQADKKDKERPYIPFKEVGGVVAIGAAAEAERRWRTGRSLIKQAVSRALWSAAIQTADAGQALHLMAWHEFGGDTPKPTTEQFEKHTTPNPGSFTDAALADMKAGRFDHPERFTPTERRQLQRVAAALSFDRRHGLEPIGGRGEHLAFDLS